MSANPYTSPDYFPREQYSTSKPPKVIFWFKVYCAILCLMYFCVTAVSFVFFTVDPAELEMGPTEAAIMGGVFLFGGGVFFLISFIPFILKPKPWVWIYDIVVICIGLTSACFWPICIPLLIFWLREDVKAYFGRR